MMKHTKNSFTIYTKLTKPFSLTFSSMADMSESFISWSVKLLSILFRMVFTPGLPLVLPLCRFPDPSTTGEFKSGVGAFSKVLLRFLGLVMAGVFKSGVGTFSNVLLRFLGLAMAGEFKSGVGAFSNVLLRFLAGGTCGEKRSGVFTLSPLRFLFPFAEPGVAYKQRIATLLQYGI